MKNKSTRDAETVARIATLAFKEGAGLLSEAEISELDNFVNATLELDGAIQDYFGNLTAAAYKLGRAG